MYVCESQPTSSNSNIILCHGFSDNQSLFVTKSYVDAHESRAVLVLHMLLGCYGGHNTRHTAQHTTRSTSLFGPVCADCHQAFIKNKQTSDTRTHYGEMHLTSLPAPTVGSNRL